MRLWEASAAACMNLCMQASSQSAEGAAAAVAAATTMHATKARRAGLMPHIWPNHRETQNCRSSSASSFFEMFATPVASPSFGAPCLSLSTRTSVAAAFTR